MPEPPNIKVDDHEAAANAQPQPVHSARAASSIQRRGEMVCFRIASHAAGSMPWGLGKRRSIHASLSSSSLARLTADDVEPVNWAQGEYASQLSAAQYAMALAAVGQYRRHVQGWWAEGWDLLLTPTLAAPPLPVGGLYGDQGDGVDPDNPMAPSIRSGRFVAFTPQFNASGQPAISLPLHENDAGLPIGVQLVAAYGREDVLIQVAAQVEAQVDWAAGRAPIHA